MLRLDGIGPEEIPLTDWEQVPDLMAHYRVPAVSVAWTDGSGEPVARARGAGPETASRRARSPNRLSAVTALALVGRGVLAQRTLTQATERAVGLTPLPRPPRAGAVPVGAARVYRVRPGYDLSVAGGPGGPTVRVPGQDPVPLLGCDDGRFVLDGLVATSLEFTGAGAAVLRQGRQEWRLERESARALPQRAAATAGCGSAGTVGV